MLQEKFKVGKNCFSRAEIYVLIKIFIEQCEQTNTHTQYIMTKHRNKCHYVSKKTKHIVQYVCNKYIAVHIYKQGHLYQMKTFLFYFIE